MVLGFLIVLISAVPLRDLAPDHGMVYHSPSKKVVPHDVSFEPGGAVHGITENGCKFSKTGWRSSDGKVVFLEVNYCKSPAHAQRVLNKLVRKATKIFERKTLTSKEDWKKNGDRIIVTFTKSLIKRPEMILWTEGNKIYMVESTSFGPLVFEKKFPNV